MVDQECRALIVEDEILVAMQLEMELNALGYATCGPVTTGEEALEIVRDSVPDVVLMDIRLVGQMGGIEVARAIRSFSDVPILFVTGYADEQLKEAAMALQPADCLVKPVRQRDLKEALESFE